LLPAGRPAELLSILPHDRSCRFEANADAAARVDKGAFGGNSPTTSSAVNKGAILLPP
jgi:hypothetical protein